MKNKLKIMLAIIILLIVADMCMGIMAEPLPPPGYKDIPPEKTLHYNIIRHHVITGKTDTAVSYQDIIFNDGDDFDIGIKIINKNDVDILFKIENITVHDHFKLRPASGEWRIEDRITPSKVDFCELNYPKAQQTVNSNSEKIINISISCHNVSCIKKYEHENACWFTLIPKITYHVDGKDKEITSHDYYVESFKLRTDNPSEPLNNLGQECNNSDDCLAGICFFCPSDTTAAIETDDDPMYAGLTDDEHWVAKDGGDGYCALRAMPTRKCEGRWNNDNYSVLTPYSIKDSSINKELTQEGLDKWKELVLNDISESYFNSHIDIVDIDSQIEDDILGMGIQYRFKYDWAETEGTSREVIYIKRKAGEKWEWLSDEEIKQRFQEKRDFLHNFRDSRGSTGYIKPTEEEIPSIISEEEAAKKLKTCHRNMVIREIRIRSVNNTLLFTAEGHVDTNTKNCFLRKNGRYTVVYGSVSLASGEVECGSHESACVVYAPGKGVSGEKSAGLFGRIISWIKNLFG